MQLYLDILRTEPGIADIYYNLGLIFQARAKADEALAYYKKALELKPEWETEVNNNIAEIFAGQGNFAEAINYYQKVIARRPDWFEANYYLGRLLQKTGRPEAALKYFQQAVFLRPGFAPAFYHLGEALDDTGKYPEAADSYRQALKSDPYRPEIHLDLGVVLTRLGNYAEAMQHFQIAASIQPEWPEIYYNQGIIYSAVHKFSEAVNHYRKALELKPGWPEACNNLGNALFSLGNINQAADYYLQALAYNNFKESDTLAEKLSIITEPRQHDNSRRPDFPAAYSSLLMSQQYTETLDQETNKKLLSLFRQSLPHNQKIIKYGNSKNPDRKIKIGYVSADFRNHSCSWFIQPVLAAHNPEQFEIYCYDNSFRTENFSGQKYLNISALSDAQLAELIHKEQIDILVDLSGHTAGNRLGLFALKPAPVQVSWLGFPASSGLDTIDYRVSDHWLSPPGTTEYYSEKIWNLELAHCYQPPASPPPVRALPCLENHFITFGSFNNFTKVGPFTVRLWSLVLSSVPGSRLILKSSEGNDEQARARLFNLFADNGIDESRIKIMGRVTGTGGHLDCYSLVDIALDTYPYNGATTTLEALLMGVPVLTLAGSRTASRYGLSFLQALGLEHLVCYEQQHYLETSCSLADDIFSLQNLRGGLRQMLLKSPLCDRALFTANLEAAYREMFQIWRTAL